MRGRELYINLDFDMSLRAGGGRRDLAARRARDLAPAFLLAGGREDRVLLEDRVPAEFLEYLGAQGFEPAAVGRTDEPETDREFVPYGWNERAAELARRYQRVPEHPELEVVGRVNSREFSAELERELFRDANADADGHADEDGGEHGDGHGLGMFETLEDLERALRSADAPPGGFVVKANHSNAGLGNCRLRTAEPTPDERRVIARILEESGAVALEIWRRRVKDLVATMRVEREGTASSVRVHEIVNTAEGSFLGAIHGGESPPCEAELRDAAQQVAARLASAGFFGPACFDAFTWRDGDRTRLRPLVDLNARLGMSQPTRQVARRLGEDRVCYGRFFSARRFPFGGDQEEFEERIGDRGFDPGARRGVLLASPLRLGDGDDARVARRFAVVFVGESREEVLGMDSSFRDEFDRGRSRES